MNFLITNDDGFDAPGLVALYQALACLGNVTVVAPAECHSSRGHAVDTKNSIRIKRHQHPRMGDVTVVHSSPADCVRIGLSKIVDERPDVVVAGINPGANLGVDLFYSGTAAAAREAAIMGVPAFALSRYLDPKRAVDWDILSQHASRLMSTMLADRFRLPAGCFWNVNFPETTRNAYPEQITFAPHSILPHQIAFRTVSNVDGVETIQFSGEYRSRGKNGDCDVSQLFDEKLTATPVGLSFSGIEHIPDNLQVSLVDPNCVN
jgi:5'/3'-nucleotidase